MSRGQLRIYLGAAPGVGKTFALLNEGQRRRARGTDVVVGYVETHDRPHTAAQLGDLEIVPRRQLDHRGTRMEEMDLDAVLARRPQVALVDELAHTNVPGSRHPKRWEDVHDLLDAGIDVITTVNVQHLESLNDVVEAITGIHQRETVPDRVVREADQVELIDMTPEALRRRMAHGNVYGPEKVDAALANYFRIGNLAALRELALLWVADNVDEALQAYLAEHGIAGSWETRERVVVAVTSAPSAETLIRRGARMARRHGDLFGIHVRTADGLTRGGADAVEAHHRLLDDLGGQFHEVVTNDVAEGLLAFARSVRATQLIIGASGRSRWNEMLSGSVVNKVIRLSGDIDVHVISPDGDDAAGPEGALPPIARHRTVTVSPRRQAAAWSAAAVLLPLLTAMLAAVPIELSATLLLYLLVVCLAAAIGGLQPALGTALGATLTANYYFTEPRHTLRVDNAEQFIALAVFVAVAILISVLVGQATRLAATARRARAEAEALAAAAGRLSLGEDALTGLLARIRAIFNQDTAALVERSGDGTWRVEAAVGDGAAPSAAAVGDGDPDTAGTVVEAGDGVRLVLHPGHLGGDDRRILDAFAAQLVAARHRHRLEAAARDLQSQQQADQFRTAILRAVSHDLRSPLASIKASATSLLQDDIAWTADQRHEFADTIDQETDRLNRLIGNLLDMSRIEAGAVRPAAEPVHLDDVVAAAVASLDGAVGRLDLDLDSDPVAGADAALLERVVANLVANALLHTSDGTPVRVETATVAGRAVVRVIDRGPGVPEADRGRLFEPFQRLGDQKPGGVGLGLAVARGFVAAMHGELSLDDTPGGGLTVTVTLPAPAPRVSHGTASAAGATSSADTTNSASSAGPAGTIGAAGPAGTIGAAGVGRPGGGV